MTPEIIHSILLIFVITLSFMLPKTILANYDLQIGAALFVLLFIIKRIRKDRLFDSLIFTFIILTIVNSTGGVSSQFFFLLYFLLFSLSLLLEPVISITSTLALIVFFLMSLPANQSFKDLMPIFSLAFLTPFALFMGQEYIEAQSSKLKAQRLQEDTFLFLSLIIKNHLKNIRYALENFMGDHELHSIKKHVKSMEQLIKKFEKSA